MQSEVIFNRNVKGNAQGNVVYYRHDGPNIVVKNGVLRTSKKGDIDFILHGDLTNRGVLHPVTSPEIIDMWLRDETPDTLTEELLSKVNEAGLRELAKVYGLNKRKHGEHPSIIKSMLRGRVVNNATLLVLEKNKDESGVQDWLKLATDAGLIYRNAPWYKYKVGDEPSDKDLSLGKTEVKAQEWALKHKDEIETRIK